MSKNKKKSKVSLDKSVAEAALYTGEDLDEDGFFILKPTDEGRKRIDSNKPKLRVIEAEDFEQNKVLREIGYDIEPISDMVDRIEDHIRQNRFTKGISEFDARTFAGFITELEKLNPEDKNPAIKPMFEIARRLITIGKSYYEYDTEVRNIFSDRQYDALISMYNKTGNPEPTGIIPKGHKTLQKAAQTYKTLHNNMDKCYIIHDGEPIPEGVKETDSVQSFLTRVYKECDIPHSVQITVDLSPKEDGVSVNGTVHNGKLRGPQTRGDANESVVVIGLNNVTIADEKLDHDDFGIQFEAICTRENAKKAEEYLKLETPYASPRHAAAGIIHRLSTMEDSYLASLISLYPINSEGLEGTYLERMDFLRNFALMPADTPSRRLVTGNFEELLSQIQKYFEEMIDARSELGHSIDGIVISIANDEYQERMGRLGRTNKWQIALKFNPASENSKASYIRLDSGRKGYRTLQLYLEHPVLLDGVEYDHVPILSTRLFKEHNLRHGTVVNIHRVGDVIPAISVVEEGKGERLRLPEVCPSCGKRLVIKNEKLYCDNDRCPDNLVGLLVGFFETMGMDGYSDSFARLLIEKMHVTSIGDLLDLEDEDFRKADCLGALSVGVADLLTKAIESKRDFEILGAMGIPNMGSARAQKFIQAFAEDIDWTEEGPELMLTNKSKVTKALSFALAPSMFEDANEFYWGHWFQKSWKALIPHIKKRVSGGKEKITRVGHHGGKLSAEVRAVCDKNGFIITDGSGFDILITTSLSGGGTKMNRARKLNLPIYLPESFIGQYGA